MGAYSRDQLTQMITQAAQDIGVPPEIAIAQIVVQESWGLRDDVVYGPFVGAAGERGMTQFTPGTWAITMPGIPHTQAYDPPTALDAWQRLMSKLLSRCNWDFYCALKAYNGSGARAGAYATNVLANAGWSDRYPAKAVTTADALNLPSLLDPKSDELSASPLAAWLPYLLLFGGAAFLWWAWED